MPKLSKNKLGFTCPGCGQKAWASPVAEIACVPCSLKMEPDPPKGAAMISRLTKRLFG